MSSGSLEPPCVKILGGSSEAMHVRVFEPPADPEPPPCTVQSPSSVFDSAILLLGSSITLPPISKTGVAEAARARVPPHRIAPVATRHGVRTKHRVNQ